MKDFKLEIRNIKDDDKITFYACLTYVGKDREFINAIEQVKEAFGGNVNVFDKTEDVLSFIQAKQWRNKVLLMMSSGTFDGIDYDKLGVKIIEKFNN